MYGLSLMKTCAILLGLAIAGVGMPALAADSGSSEPAEIKCTAPKVPNATKTRCVPCPDGTVYDKDKKICVTKNAILMDDATLYETGRALAKAGYYQEALETFAAIRDKNDAMVLTMTGYATRKLGRTEEGIALYHQALAIDPANVNTHEYLGEGYLATGRVDLAEVELDTLEKLCGKTCPQYQDLAKAIAGDPVWN